ncbi:MAG: SUMF1/EgtB/PvdO family nonheme iron enzyme [Deltaproteobacteria bacterium]|nr:SUMF1/EgtB/PvdO family nonheme iron enzyme [Deltaproteobacteria bacterium]
MTGTAINPGLQFISTAGVPGLVSGIRTGIIQPAQALNAFQAVGSAIDTYVTAFPQDTNLVGLRSSISGLPATPPIPAQAQQEILGQLTAHQRDVELAVRMAIKVGNVGQVAVTSGAAVANIEAPFDLGAEWKWIPAGTFQMGSADNDEYAYDDEKPLRSVATGGFFMLDHPVTNREWIAFLEATGNKDLRDLSEKFAGADQPAVLVNHREASAYAQWIGEQVSAQAEQSVIGRLPTEQEWERAAKGPDGNEFIIPATSRQAHFDADGKTDRTRTVTDPEAYVNGFGLKDMIGNVWEWTSSPWREGSGTFVLRGASWVVNYPLLLRAAFRFDCYPDARDFIIGFRPVLVPQDPKKS